jgi:hypothetical protein
MSKENNLTDFLTDVADAIREKKGTSEKINPQDFSEEIRNIQSGGGEVVEVEEKDVNFYDYDGTLLFSYTIAEAQALTELPTPKGHSGLIFDGWNWDYEEVIALDYPMNIGAMYKTDDGKTRLYLKVEEPTSISLSFNNTGTATVDFGDGEVVETSETTPVLPHRYEVGEYVLRISGTNRYRLIQDVEVRNILGFCVAESSGLIRKVEIGERCEVLQWAFKACFNMETITFPSVISNAGWTQTYVSSGIKHLNIPQNRDIYVNGCQQTPKLRMICLPSKPRYLSDSFISFSGIEKLAVPQGFAGLKAPSPSALRKFRWPTASTLPNSTFSKCYYLEEVVLPDNITILPTNIFLECRCLRTFNMPSALEEISQAALYGCTSLFRLPPFPSTLRTIGANAFFNINPKEFDFSACAQVPTLNNTNAFSGTSGAIVVPDNLYDEWVVATNWSTLANRIVKDSEYTRPL